MGIINFDILTKITLGDKKDFANLTNLRLLNDSDRFTKSEILSIFKNEEDKRVAEKIFSILNTDKTGDTDTEEFLDREELIDVFEDLNGSVDSDDNFNWSDAEVQTYFKEKNIDSKDASILFKIIKHLTTTKDYSTIAQSGTYTVDDEETELQLTKDKNDASGRTYFCKDKANGEKFNAVFGGKSSKLQVMTSELYNLALEDTDVKAREIVSQVSDVKGVIVPQIELSEKNLKAKIGMDILLGNLEAGNSLNFAGALDTNSRNRKKEFSKIPTEFSQITSNMTREDVLAALETVAALEDEAIVEILRNYEVEDQYADTILERKHALTKMYQNALENPFEPIKPEQPTARKQQPEKNPPPPPLPEITMEEFMARIKDFNCEDATWVNDPTRPMSKKEIKYLKENYGENYKENVTKKIGSFKKKLTEQERNLLKERFGEDAGRVIHGLSNISYAEMLKDINNNRQKGFDVFKNQETFDEYLVMFRVMTSTNFDEKTFNVVDDSLKNVNQEDKDVIRLYKSDDFWRINNALTTLEVEDREPLPLHKDTIDRLTALINRTQTSTNISLYRGEGYEIFKKIQTADGRTLGERMYDVAHPKEDTNVQAEIDALMAEVQNNNFATTQERFLSTSISSKVAEDFGSVSLILDLPKGSNAICIDAKNLDHVCDGEQEILCQRGSTLQVKELSYDSEKHRWTVVATVITK